MARKKQHHNLKPKVSLVTYIILGVIFVALTVAIILSFDTKNERFNKLYNLDEHSYQVSNLKKVRRSVTNNENVLVLFTIEQPANKEQQQPGGFSDASLLVEETNNLYNEENSYLSELTNKILYVEVTLKDREALQELLLDYEVSYLTNSLMLLYFENDQLVSELNINKSHSVHPEGNVAKRNMIENLNEFIQNIQDNLTEE